MKKILVTGANGYIGRYVTKTLLENEYEVIAADVHFDNVDSRATYFRDSIFDIKENLYVELGQPDVCIHLAWQDGFVHNAPSHMEKLSQHYRFLKDLGEQGCKNITVMGSMHEIGYWEGAIEAETPCNPLSLYGISKNALRQSLLLMARNNGVSLKWLRAYYILGDDLHNNSIFTKLIQAERDGKKEFPFTSGKNKYDFIDVKELGFQIAAAAVQTDISGIINTCTGQPVSLGEKVEDFIKQNRLNISLKYGAFPDRDYDSPIVYGDNTQITKIINATALHKI
ncbi:MAG: NAD(P)-dependent oxidoreductase [Lachnospiraceae bacterium]|nr:NAD(P)-dependent oxidoreductase [Lachnospiraceae bacterium]